MKLSKIITLFLALAIVFAFAGTAFSQDDPVTIAGILEEAGCPLTEDEEKQLKDMDISEGFQIFRTLFEIFDDDQNEALKEALGTQPGRNDRPDRPRYIFQMVILENAGYPLTESQIKKLKDLPTGQGRGFGGGQAMMEILNDDQKKVMGSFRGGRGGGGRRRGNR